MGLQFSIEGIRSGEATLYITTSESETEIKAIAHSHGWALDGLAVHYHSAQEAVEHGESQTVFHSTEIELPRTIETLLQVVDQAKPARLVIDSLSEIRTLARNESWYRRQLMFLRNYFLANQCTVLLVDEGYGEGRQLALSIVSGVIDLEQIFPDYGPERRRLRILKFRGASYQGGHHDFHIRTGGMVVYPRLVAPEGRRFVPPGRISSGLPELDHLLAGGLDKATNAILIGPAGTGKSLVATQFAAAASDRGERSAIYIFDEKEQTLIERSRGIGLDLQRRIDEGTVRIHPVHPGELSAGAFSDKVRRAIVDDGVRLAVIDSLNGYVHAMSDDRLLVVHLHDLLSYLNQFEVTPVVVIAQHGLPGAPLETPVDISYLADTVLLFRHFEYAGEVRKAVSVFKRRAGPHESTIRELRISERGLHVGEPLKDFQGVLTGQPTFVGEVIHGAQRAPARKRRS